MAETKTPKRDYQQEAKLAVDPATRQDAQAKALASQLEQQDAERADVVDAQEQTARAVHAAEGGGAWPEDLLLKRYVTPPASAAPAFAPEQNYTSHEGTTKSS